MQQIGLNIVDETRLAVAHRIFAKYIPVSITGRPREGDLIYVPVLHKLMEILRVNEDDSYHALGRPSKDPYYYVLHCQTFKYSHEKFDTGLPDIDKDIIPEIAYTIALSMNVSQAGNYIISEVVFQGSNITFANATGKVVDWSPTDGVLKVMSTLGEFENNVAVRGASSNTARTLTTVGSVIDSVAPHMNLNDATTIQGDANTIIVTTETNRFGAP
jgi:hypothetical protein